MICHVVRCFEDENIIHVNNTVSPAADMETINTELALADLDTVDKRADKLPRMLRSPDKAVVKEAQLSEPLLARLQAALGEGKPARSLEFNDDETLIVRDLHLLTMKKQIIVCNVDEAGLETENEYVKTVKAAAAADGAEVVTICGQLEADIAALETPAERGEFLAEAGLTESGLAKLIHAGYKALGLQTYFTAGTDENRAWTIPVGASAPEAAGVIHTDFQRGFIKAEVYHCDDLFEYGSEDAIKKAGKLRMEGKAYIVQDGDIMHFKFNV